MSEPRSRKSTSCPVCRPTYQLAARRSLVTLPSATLKMGRSLSSSVSGKSQPMPPVAETLFHLAGMRRESAPWVATKVGS
ncbi:Uncharacterised protein [Bordetella pertussis]|nr:Uncharacterised protein [Bordetella pertussis]CFP67551.1 Uncharacterised protein [Bordetella pertussis]